jgi:hypothetical protein
VSSNSELVGHDMRMRSTRSPARMVEVNELYVETASSDVARSR